MKKVMKFVNYLNLKLNCLLKPKKVTNSKITMYLWNSVIKEIVAIINIISQGKAVKLSIFTSSNFYDLRI